MTDPAKDARDRAWHYTSPHSWDDKCSGLAVAREALAPLRAKHHKVQRPDGTYRCTSCRDGYGAHADWPTGTDRLLYAEEEL